MFPFPTTTPELLAGRSVTFVAFRRAVWAGRLPSSHYTWDKWHIAFDPACQVITVRSRSAVALAKVTTVPMSNVVCFALEVVPEPMPAS